MNYRRTHTITDIDWNRIFMVYESAHADVHARIDGAVPQAWFDENYQTLTRRFGACWVYDDDNKFGRPMYRDEILSDIGIYLGYTEVTE